MKTARLWFLILLSLLLPVRGVVAAGMQCLGVGRAVVATVDPHVGHDMGVHGHHGDPTGDPTGDHHADPHAAHHPAATDAASHPATHAAAHDAGAPDTCKLCCDFCSMTPLLADLPTLAAPQHFSTVAFPELAAPAPRFVEEGPERPPRST